MTRKRSEEDDRVIGEKEMIKGKRVEENKTRGEEGRKRVRKKEG